MLKRLSISRMKPTSSWWFMFLMNVVCVVGHLYTVKMYCCEIGGIARQCKNSREKKAERGTSQMQRKQNCRNLLLQCQLGFLKWESSRPKESQTKQPRQKTV